MPSDPGFSPPQKLDNLRLVYATPPGALFANPGAVIAKRSASVEAIVPDVAAPGDFMVFGKAWKTSKSLLTEALRRVPHAARKGMQHHAL